ncbi:shufflon system plasmid conjugative transfer pilus tip adhesin PilV [Desulfovibrio sp. An276]|uniref:shufflon system plasmid conjugative transfer pilus tip adhesin PilV n=1 Tax=Desulfovibrio sp. An276 TaxID=1965618 RepID=UPI001184BDC5|nr:shufflon system plasmid conjugative transfer pilus tip adhesin PilV [Desulfovibrio sp. An276]
MKRKASMHKSRRTVPRTGTGAGEAGFTLVEVLGAILVAGIMLTLLTGVVQRGSVWMEQASAASHLRMVAEAFQGYASLHETELLAEAGQASGPSVTLEDLAREGFLPQGFAATNLWNQDYVLHVRKIELSFQAEGTEGGDGSDDDAQTISRLALVVLTSGGRGSVYDADNATFLNVHVPGAAARAGVHAGYIPGRDRDGATASDLVSGQGSYVLPLADLGIASPGPGHLGAYLVLNAREESSSDNFLHRVAVPGRPELNQMETVLDMTGNGIVNTGFVRLDEHNLVAGSSPLAGEGTACSGEDLGKLFLDKNFGLYLCRLVRGEDGSEVAQLALLSDSANAVSVQGMTLAADNELIERPLCASGTGAEAQIFVAPAMASSGPSSPAMAALRAWASVEDETHWRVHIRVKNTEHDTGSWYEPAQEGTNSLAYGAAQVITACVRKSQDPGSHAGE